MGDPDKINPRQYFNDVQPAGYIIRMGTDYWRTAWVGSLNLARVFPSREEAQQAPPFEIDDEISHNSIIVPVWRDENGRLVESAPQARVQITEAKVAGAVLKARILESWDKATEDYVERYDRHLEDLAVGLKQSGGKGRVPWPKVPAARLKRIWLDFGKTHVVRDEKGLEEIAELVLSNIARLRAATDMMGHSQMDARSFLDDMGHAYTDEEWEDWMSNWMTDERGNWVLSDYGMQPLEKLYGKIYSAPTAEDKLQWIDRALNVVHQRSDLAALFVEGGSKTLDEIFKQGGYTSANEPAPKLESADPDAVNPRDYVLGGNWQYVVVYSDSRGRKFFDLKAYEDGKLRRVVNTTPWTDDAEKATKFDRAEAEKWQAEWQGIDFKDNAVRYSISPVTPDSILPPRNVRENEEPPEEEEVDPDMPVDPKKFLMRLDFRGEERIKALEKFGEFGNSGNWYIPYSRIGYESDFSEQANYKHFKEKYPFLTVLDGGYGNGIGFDKDAFPEEYASFEEFIAQIDETDWEQFIEDVGVAYNGTALDDDETFRLEQEETMRYVSEDFLPDFKREVKELVPFQNSFLQYVVSQLDGDRVWTLMREKEKYPEPEGGGHVHLKSETLVDGIEVDEIMDLFEGVPLKEQWEKEKQNFYESEQGRWFDKSLAEAVTASPEAQHALAQLSEQDVFALLKSLVPDTNFANPMLPRWDEVDYRAAGADKAVSRWVVTYPVAKQWDNQYWHRYCQSALQDLAEVATKRLPTWSRPVPDHPEFPMWESGPDDVDPTEYLQAVGSYWGIAYQKNGKPIWYTGNPWDRWAFEMEDAKRFKSEAQALDFCRAFGPDWHVDIKPKMLPELHQESGPDDIEPENYVGKLRRAYGIAQKWTPDSTDLMWAVGNRFTGYGWTEEVENAKSFNSEQEAKDELLFLATKVSFDAISRMHVVPLPEIKMQESGPDAINPREYLSSMGGGFVAVIDDGPRRYYFNSHPHGWWTLKEKAMIFSSAEEAFRVSTASLPEDKKLGVKVEPALVNEARIRKQKLPDDEDIDYKDWVMHGGYDSGKELYSDQTVRVLIPQTFHTIEKYGFGVAGDRAPDSWDHYSEPGPIFIVIPTKGEAWMVREWYDEIRECSKHGNWHTAYPDELVKTRPEGVKAGQVLAKFFKKYLKDDFDKYFKFVFGFGGLSMVKGYLRRMRPGADYGMDNSIAIQAITQGDVKTAAKFFKCPVDQMDKNGLWITYNDYNDLSVLFKDDNRQNHQKAAEQIFSGEHSDWFDFLYDQKISVQDMSDFFTPEHYEQIREALVGRSILIDDEPVLLTPDKLKEFDNDTIEEWLENHEDYQDGGDLEPIVEAIQEAGQRALRTIYEDAYFKGYLGVVEDALGSQPVWKKIGDKDRIGFFVSWQKIREWMKEYEEEHGEPYSGNIDDLPQDTLKLEASEEYHGSLDDDKPTVVEALSEMLSELSPLPYRENVDPQQLDMFGHEPQDNTLAYHQVYNEHYPNGATVQFTNSNWKKFQQERPQETSKEAWDAYAAQNKIQPKSPLGESLLMEDGYKFAVTLIPLPEEVGGFVTNWGNVNIPEEWLYSKEGDDTMGRELEPHITVKYGLTVSEVPDALRDIVATTRPFPVFFEKVSLFNTNPDYDVVKLGIESPWLQELNKRIKTAIPNEDKFPVYRPHCTIAYVKKGLADKLAGLDIFGPGGVKPQFTAMGLVFKGACEDKADPNRVKETLMFSITKKPQTESSEGPDDINPREYVQNWEEVLASMGYKKGGDATPVYSKVVPSPYIKPGKFLILATIMDQDQRVPRVVVGMHAIFQDGTTTPVFSAIEYSIFQLFQLKGLERAFVEAKDTNDFYRLIGQSVEEAGPDDIDAREFVKEMPLYYVVSGKFMPEFIDKFDGEARGLTRTDYYFDSAGGTRAQPQRMGHSQALKVAQHVREEYPWFEVQVLPADDQSQMFWQGRRTPQEIGEAEDPDAIEPREYMRDVPVEYVIKKTGSSERHKSAGIGWFWNSHWGWRSSLSGATRYQNRVEADDMLRERGLQGYAVVQPLINESTPQPFDNLPFPTDSSQLIRFLRSKRAAPQLL